MNLGECENILKKNYNISNNASLFILQIISQEEGMKIPKVDYEVYYPLYNSNNLTKLNLDLCKGTNIEISISVNISGSLDKYNPNSGYYNDICYKTTSESGTDIILNDRRNEFVDNNMSLCEENCDLIEYIQEKEKAKCSCNIKLNIPPDYNSKFNKNDFFKSFIDVNNIFNFNVLKCYKIVFKSDSLRKNYGFFIVCSIMVLYFIDLLFFILVSYRYIKKEIRQIFYVLKNRANPIKKYKDKTKNMRKIKFYDINDIKTNEDKINLPFNLDEKMKVKNKNLHQQITQNFTYGSFNKINSTKNLFNFINDIYINKLLEIKNFELNSLSYKAALKLDHRSFCEYYGTLFINNHPVLFSFGSYNDYNSKIIKMFLFFFSFCLDFSVNALFFTDDTIHKIYEDKGKFNFLYQIPQILYSTIISRFIDSFIRNFALTQDNFVGLKRKLIKKKNKKYNKFKRMLKIKFILFYITTFIALVLFWYYITCFCGIYINSQIHLINDCIISLITSLLIPFVFYLIPGIIRISSLRVEKPRGKFLYKLSLVLENWLC